MAELAKLTQEEWEELWQTATVYDSLEEIKEEILAELNAIAIPRFDAQTKYRIFGVDLRPEMNHLQAIY